MGSLESKPRCGAPQKHSQRAVRSIIKSCQNNPFYSASEISCEYNHTNKTDKDVTPKYVQYILRKSGLRSYVARKKPFLNKSQIKKRIEFCQQYKDMDDEFWKNVFFSDESYFEINLDSVMNRVRRFSFQNPLESRLIKKTVKYPLKVMIWGCFSYHGLGRIKVCEGTMNREKYLETLEEKLLPSIHDFMTSNAIHLDDSAPPHRGNTINEWHERNNIQKIKWPGNSPDLNPIENLWAIMKSKLRRRIITNKRRLIEEIINIWRNEIDHEVIKRLALSMKQRINNVLKNKGNSSNY